MRLGFARPAAGSVRLAFTVLVSSLLCAGVQAADSIALALQAQAESISGVSLDEETVSMLRLERAFQGAARYTSVVDQMMQEMLALVR